MCPLLQPQTPSRTLGLRGPKLTSAQQDSGLGKIGFRLVCSLIDSSAMLCRTSERRVLDFMKNSTISNQGMEYFRAKQRDIVIAPVFGKSEISMARLSCVTPGHGVIDPPAYENAFFLAFNLRDYEGDLWVDGKKVDTKISRRGNFTIYDHRRSWLADMRSAFDGVGFHIPVRH